MARRLQRGCIGLSLRTRNRVQSDGKPIHAVAKALLEKKHLSAEEVYKTIDASFGLAPTLFKAAAKKNNGSGITI